MRIPTCIPTVYRRIPKTYFHDEKNVEIVNRLRGYGLQMSLSEEQMQQTSDRLAGLNIVISGVFARHSRDEYKALIEQHGGKNVGSISKKTSFILAGENMGPSKLEKAQKLGIELLDEDTFLSRYGLDNLPQGTPVTPATPVTPELPATSVTGELSLF